MEGRFTVIAVDGEVLEIDDPYTNSLRYDGLVWAEAVELCRLSFLQGFKCVIWSLGNEEDAE